MDFSAKWMYAFAIIGGLVAAYRIWQNLQKLRQRQNDSWDARLIDQLRKRGSDPFKPHDVDFFLAFSTRQAAEQLATTLRGEGFDADVHESPESGDLAFSLHAHKSMQLTVPDMQDLSRRLTEAATTLGGRYDGWSAKQVPRTGPIE
jgi:regulator of ribonuclease activity B